MSLWKASINSEQIKKELDKDAMENTNTSHYYMAGLRQQRFTHQPCAERYARD